MNKYCKKDEGYHLIPLILMVFIVPIIVRLKIIPLSGARFEFWTGAKQVSDFFSYYKMVWILGCSLLSIIMLMIKGYQQQYKIFRKSYYFIPIAVYSLVVILSTLLSEYKDISIWGFVDRYEGMFVLLAYMIILLVTMILVDSEYHVKFILTTLIFSAIIIGTIGVFQYIGLDVFKTNFGKSFMLPSEFMRQADKVEFKFGKNVIYSTLYHYNYVGSYMAMLFPLTLTIFILIKNKKAKIFMCIVTTLMAINWIACNSRAGIIGGGIALIVLLIMMRKYVKEKKKNFGIAVIIFIVVFVALNLISNGVLSSRIKTLSSELKTAVISDKKTEDFRNLIPLKDVKTKGNTAFINIDNRILNIETREADMLFTDESKKNINIENKSDTGKIILKDERYKNYDITLANMNGKNILYINKGNIKLYFELKSKYIGIVDYKGKSIDIDNIQSFGFKGKELLASSRGYIWSRSLPLVKDKLLLGHGPDTFAAYFPQQDIKGKMYAYNGDMWQLVDKPHNLYLQTAINTGLISLIAMLALFIMYLIKSFKIYYNSSFKDFNSIAGLGIFVAVVGYLGAAIFNDSVVSVAPVFWILLGMGISINKILTPKAI
ncbi:O-antigen ligase family protein [Clostridium tagluense]|uniref:O-antigen ligase family protein n=1 Tax=Clostridium tagluense TaxID=360422 RepID=UPI001C0B9015|nr:O-antigen ligase family protein [Clostridium tagluense]MBU3127139.1 O-antigen ligase family protein [Clostridium tagluense]MCB2312007.1 O-antigen ligase family protein [Clostridium tagluense]MCB2316594.1 O-antigen ligase family protein [Clostridium tagluense]MCB2321470.1 O-antigen ligase family protein [Clostridium tagluense]MCB2326482.1 O-antigen ligase family protein [Clostridium tagluense]